MNNLLVMCASTSTLLFFHFYHKIFNYSVIKFSSLILKEFSCLIAKIFPYSKAK